MTTDNKKEQTSALENADGAKNIAEEKKGGKISGFIKQFFDIKFWKFILVGIINTLVGEGLKFFLAYFTNIKNIGFLNIYLSFSPINNQSIETALSSFSMDIGAFFSSAIGMIVGSIISYLLNKHFTFKNKEKGWKPVLRFALNIIVCWLLANALAFIVIANICNAAQFSVFGMGVESTTKLISLLSSSVLFVGFNYIGQRFFAFREKKEKAEKIK